MNTYTDEELLAFLQEQLSSDRAADIEDSLRNSPELTTRLSELVEVSFQDHHSVGQIWRREQLSCPNRSQLGAWMLGTIDTKQAKYLEFHLNVIGCRPCNANMEDLKTAAEEQKSALTRRQKYFQTSIGYLKKS
ncbi:hypothetical protein Pla110_27620 [Polystyrenella longa]|uniref:Uncharacterized protein n=1 Tax=Polystyrenella longa TaxID=2528007 RepID=A0A518CP76_9PLAN|nr:hypothetical protein [Polystyrenella longa]QDU81025.1 hypothetical protein Pla110_27620 [Polystyrenella longa]